MDTLLPPSALPWLLLALAVGAAGGVALATLLGHQVLKRRRAEYAAARAQADLLPLAQALRHSLEVVVVTDVARRITWVNEAFERVTGWTAAEALGRTPAELLQFEGTDPATIAAMGSTLRQGLPFVGEVLNLGRRREPYWLQLEIHPLRNAAGEAAGFVSIQSDVTERKRVEAALRDGAALLGRTERIAGVGGWTWCPEQHELRFTGNGPLLLGLQPGASLRAALRRLDHEGRHALWRIVRGGGHGETEVRVVGGEAEDRWLRVTIEADRGCITGSMLDISQRRRMKAELARGAELMRAAFQAVDEAFALFDPEDRLVLCNERYREVYARSCGAIHTGARYEDIVRFGAERGQYGAAEGRVEEWVAQHMAARRHGGTARVQRLADGRILRVIDRRMPDGHTVGFRVDITELVRATEAAEGADRSKSEFIATVSHELRTPLQVITGFSDLGRHFAQGPAQPQAQFGPMFDDIHAAGLRMLHLVNGLLDFSKFSGATAQLLLRRQPLAPLAAAVARELAPLAQERALHIALDVPAGLHADADGFRLQQVLRNVIANALRFAPAGTTIELQGRSLGLDGMELTVRDHGPGIPPDELDSIFEPFVQSSRTRDGAGGTGLGLAICRRLMAAHGGRITAESAAGGGACFRLWLPPASPEPAPEGAAEAGPERAPAAAPRVKLSTLRAAFRTEEPTCPEPS